MFFRQFYDQPLAQASYMIGCQATGNAIVIDPLRDVSQYLDVAKAENLRISHITETHIHADFVSGARELAAHTGATLYLSAEGGHDWQYAFAASDGATLLHDGDSIMVGNIRLDVMHTPGHTPEHLSFVVTDEPASSGPMGVVTGDFVFVGDVGRPDLLEKAAHVANTMDAAARQLFHSLTRFVALPDHLQVWPGHGAGSACGKALGAVPSSTVGYEKRANWGLRTTNEEEFVRTVLDGQPEPPAYFAQMKRINREGPRVLGARTLPEQTAANALPDLLRSNATVIDLRLADSFSRAHVPGTLSITHNRSFSTWAGSLVPYDVDVWLLTGEVANGEDNPDAQTLTHVPKSIAGAIQQLSMIGLDRVVGWFDASALEHWTRHVGALSSTQPITVQDFATDGSGAQLIDVRGASEWLGGHIPHSRNIPLGDLPAAVASLDPHRPIVVQCQSGARSTIACSVLERAGRTDVRNLQGGYAAWRDAGLAVAHQTEAAV